MNHKVFYSLAAALFLATATSACAAMLTFQWDYPQADESLISGYRVYYSSSAFDTAKQVKDITVPYTKIDITDKKLRTFKADVPSGTKYFRMTAFNATGDSALGTQIKADVPVGPPSNLRITVEWELAP